MIDEAILLKRWKKRKDRLRIKMDELFKTSTPENKYQGNLAYGNFLELEKCIKEVVTLDKKETKERGPLQRAIRIGEFSIFEKGQMPDSLNIFHDSGEGGGFKNEAFAAVVKKFYEDNF